MTHSSFLSDLAILMIVASLATVICRWLKQPVVIGYLLSGLVIGPYTPPATFINNLETIQTLSELGLVMLMFFLGLHFDIRKVGQLGGPVLITALIEIPVVIFGGYLLGRAFGWKLMDSVFLGGLLAVSSTSIVAKTLEDLGLMKQRFAELVFSISVIEDVVAVALLGFLSSFAMTKRFDFPAVAATLGQVGMFLVAMLFLGLLVVPVLIRKVSRFHSKEMLLITVLGLCFGTALLALTLGFSLALGAFLMGAILAQVREVHQIVRVSEPIRDMFSAIFFVAVGMQIQPALIVVYWLPILLITAVFVLGKIHATMLGSLLAGNDLRTSVRVGIGLAQVGEFSFVIAALGLTLHVTSDHLYPIAVSVSCLTTLLAPPLLKNSERIGHWTERLAPPPLRQVLQLYSSWIRRWRTEEFPEKRVWKNIAHKILVEMALDFVLVAAIFMVLRQIARFIPDALKSWSFWPAYEREILWFTGLLSALPFLIAILRKWEALVLMLAGTVFSLNGEEKGMRTLRMVLSRALLTLGLIVLILWIGVASGTLLPARPVLLIMTATIAGVIWFFGRRFIRIYAQTTHAIRDVLETTPEDEEKPR